MWYFPIFRLVSKFDGYFTIFSLILKFSRVFHNFLRYIYINSIGNFTIFAGISQISRVFHSFLWYCKLFFGIAHFYGVFHNSRRYLTNSMGISQFTLLFHNCRSDYFILIDIPMGNVNCGNSPFTSEKSIILQITVEKDKINFVKYKINLKIIITISARNFYGEARYTKGGLVRGSPWSGSGGGGYPAVARDDFRIFIKAMKNLQFLIENLKFFKN